MNRYLKTLVWALSLTYLVACGTNETIKNTQTVSWQVKAQPLQQILHFAGTVQPLKESSLTSPMEGVVATMNVHYGQMVKKGDVVVTLTSNELQKQYNDTLTSYLKAKDSYSIAKAKFVGTQDLWDAGLLSKNNYLNEKSSVDTARITLIQATRKLGEMLEKMDESGTQNVSSLNLADFDKIRSILTSKHDLIHLKAPHDGIMLYPPKSGEDKLARISVGSTIKSGQVIALIGDLQGISIEIDVPEIDIGRIHPGMKATISGVAFGKHQLKGQVVTVNAQASNNTNGGLPSFTALIEVASLTPEELRWIKVGMSAAIELSVSSTNQLMIPIAAVQHKQGNNVVTLKLPQGTTEERIITTGAVQADFVVIERGLKEGDVVVYDQ